MPANIIRAELPTIAQPPFGRNVTGAVLRLLRRFASKTKSAQRLLAVEERVIIGSKKSLVIVRCQNQRFLIATSGDTIGPIIEIAPSKPARRVRREREA